MLDELRVYARPRDAQLLQQQSYDTNNQLDESPRDYNTSKQTKNDQLLHWSDVEIYAMLGLLNSITVSNVCFCIVIHKR